MRILHVIPSVEEGHGGPTAALHAIVGGLAARGCDVTVATTTAGLRSESHPGDRVTILEFPRTTPGSWKYSRSLGRWLGDSVAGFDIVHVHALFSYATIPACRAALDSGVPLVLRPLGTLDEWSLRRRSWKKRPYLRLVERRHLRGASVIHVTSEVERRGVADLGYGAKARIIPLGVQAVPTAAELEQRYALRGNEASLNVLFLSRLHPKKGLPLLMAALGRLRADTEFTFRVAGSGSAAYTRELQRLCEAEGIAANTEFLGHVRGEQKQQLLRWAHVFVLPSFQENFALAAAEAMAEGAALVLSENVGIAADAGAAGAAMVVPPEPGAIHAALQRLAGDRDLQRRMGRAGRALVEQRFTWAATSDALMRLYEELRSDTRLRQ